MTDIQERERQAREVARKMFPSSTRQLSPFMAMLARGEHLNDDFLRGAKAGVAARLNA